MFDALCARLGVQPDRDGEAHVTCPGCGKPPKHGQTHFSFGARGGFCFVCGQGWGLVALARLWGLIEGAAASATPQKPAKPKAAEAVMDFAGCLGAYEMRKDVVERWQGYKPLPEGAIYAFRLGVGTFPRYSSKCSHERLIVPLISADGSEGGQVIGLRGRSLPHGMGGCDCGKWLSPKGSRLVLYNGACLLPQGTCDPTVGVAPLGRRAHGNLLWIVENPIDAIMLQLAHPRAVAVATLGVGLWQERWTYHVAHSGALKVYVAYDNDRPGNGGGEAGKREWLKTHERDLLPNGVRLVNKLLAQGVPAVLYDWGDSPLKRDIGDLLLEDFQRAAGGRVGLAEILKHGVRAAPRQPDGSRPQPGGSRRQRAAAPAMQALV